MTATVQARLTPGRFAALIWLVTAAIMLAAFWSSIRPMSTVDPDDALRLVQVRDLLAGQNWWDVVQHRINPAGGGGLMHWSRIVDVPIAAGILLLRSVIGQSGAEQWVIAIWPLLLLGALLTLAARCYAAIGGRTIAMIATAFISIDYLILFQFAPLRIDHHGWQMLVALAMMHQLIRTDDARSGVWAGVLAAVLMAISLEGLPAIVLVAAIMAGQWLWTGRADASRRLVLFLAALTASAAVLQLATRGPVALVQHWCDALSLPYLAAFAAATIAVAVLAPLAMRMTPASRPARCGALALAGVASVAALVVIAPACAAGPFGTLDPLVIEHWYVNVHEGRPIWTSIGPIFAFALMPMLVGIAGSLLAWRAAGDDESRRRWLVVALLAAGCCAVALLVLRAVSLAHLIAMPGCAWLLLAAWQRARQVDRAGPRIMASLGAILPVPPFAGAALAVALLPLTGGVAADDAETRMIRPFACVDPPSSAALDRLPAATIMAPLDIGPHLLQRTHHSVTATGHHRNNAVMAQTIAAFIGDPALARQRAEAMQASLIVICPASTEIANFRKAEGEGLADLLTSGRAPAWLEPINLPAGARLRAWRIRPDPQATPAGPA